MSRDLLSMETNRHLARLAKRLNEDTEYMASILAMYQICERLTDQSLSELLGISPGMLARLALCKRPNPESADFAQQVRKLADFTGADVGAIANLIRQIEALEAMKVLSKKQFGQSERWSMAASQGLLAAARDRSEGEGKQGRTVEKADGSEGEEEQ